MTALPRGRVFAALAHREHDRIPWGKHSIGGRTDRPALRSQGAIGKASITAMAEFLLRWQPTARYFHRTFVRPQGGSFALAWAPGLGLEPDEAAVERVMELE